MAEDVFRGVTPDGRFVVEVVWIDGPGLEPGFICKVILDGKFTLEELKTENGDQVITWARRQMTDVMRRSTGEEKN